MVAVTSFLRTRKPKIQRIKKRLLKKENLDEFWQELSVLSWQEAYDEYECPSAAFDKLIGIVQPKFDSTCSVRTVKLKKSTPRKLWARQELLRLIQKSNDLYVLYLNSDSQEVFNDFKNFVMKLIGFAYLVFKNILG